MGVFFRTGAHKTRRNVDERIMCAISGYPYGGGTPAISFQDEKRDDKKGLEQVGKLEKSIKAELVIIDAQVKLAIAENNVGIFNNAKEQIQKLIKHIEEETWSLRLLFEKKSIRTVLYPQRKRLLQSIYSFEQSIYQKADPILPPALTLGIGPK